MEELQKITVSIVPNKEAEKKSEGFTDSVKAFCLIFMNRILEICAKCGFKYIRIKDIHELHEEGNNHSYRFLCEFTHSEEHGVKPEDKDDEKPFAFYIEVVGNSLVDEKRTDASLLDKAKKAVEKIDDMIRMEGKAGGCDPMEMIMTGRYYAADSDSPATHDYSWDEDPGKIRAYLAGTLPCEAPKSEK